jgi:glycosyltransferase involved in cell wall biosynthesis
MNESKQRVLFVLPSLRAGGAERVMVTLLRHLNRARFEPHLAVGEKTGDLIKDLPADVPVHDLSASRVRYALPGLIRFVRKLRPDVVLSTLVELNLAVIAAKPFFPRGARLLVRETIAIRTRLAQTKRWPGAWRWLYRRLYSHADLIVCIGDFVRDELINEFGIPPARLQRIYNPVDIGRLRQLAPADQNPFTGDPPHLVAVGRLSKQKGLEILLPAVRQARDALPTLSLTLVGDGPLRADLASLGDRLGLGDALRFAGFQANPYPYLRHADLLVLSSHYEGLPNVVLEALALGTPVVATACAGGVREILAPVASSGAAWLAPPGDPQKIAEALVRAWNVRRDAPRSLEEFDRFVQPFDVETIVREYEELLAH